MSFNKTIVECKVEQTDDAVKYEKVLIRPQWNVKKALENVTAEKEQVLIRPQWNVKIVGAAAASMVAWF